MTLSIAQERTRFLGYLFHQLGMAIERRRVY